jgi:hypothetical protein
VRTVGSGWITDGVDMGDLVSVVRHALYQLIYINGGGLHA